MNRNSNKGISLIALIITIIVIIILAAIVIGGVFNTPSQAKFSRWCNDVGSMQDAVLTAHGSRATQVATDVNYDRIDNTKIYKYIATLNDNAATEVIREKEMVKVDNDNNKLNIEIPKYEGQDWYIDVETGEIYMYPGFTHEKRAYMSQADIRNGGITPPVVAVVTDLKITTTASVSGTEAGTNVADGTDLWISFNATIEGEAATVAASKAVIEGVESTISGSLPYKITTNGSYTFTVSNTHGETTYTVNVTNYKVSSALLAEVAKVGDYVIYNADSGEYTPSPERTGSSSNTKQVTKNKANTGNDSIWRVWENDGTTVTLIPMSPVNSLTLGTSVQVSNTADPAPTDDTGATYGAAGYANAPTIMDEISRTLYSKSGYTTEVRHMTYNDIQLKLKTPFTVSGTNYAYYASTDGSYSSGKETKNGKTYTKSKSAYASYNGVTVPRFYDWDEGEGISYDTNPTSPTRQLFTDSNETPYMIPTVGHPVYVSYTYTGGSIASTNWADIPAGTHASSTSTYGDILGSSYSWLASPCVALGSGSAYFYVRGVSSGHLDYSNLAGSYGDSYSGSSGLRPLVSLSSTVRVNTTDSTKNGSTSGNAWIIK